MTLREQATVYKALGHPVRLAMVQRLALGACCVCELLELSEVRRVSGPTVSQHLLVLKSAGVIGDERRGQRIFYRLLMPCVAGVSQCVKQQSSAAWPQTQDFKTQDARPGELALTPSDAQFQESSRAMEVMG